jgi:integrase
VLETVNDLTHEKIPAGNLVQMLALLQYVFTLEDLVRIPYVGSVAKHFAEAREKAGLPKDLVLYCGRHDFGTVMTARTGNLKAVMKVMGHQDFKTAMRYQHPEVDIVRAALNGSQGGTAPKAST